MTRLLLATGNRHKASEMEAILRGLLPGIALDIVNAADFQDISEPEETGLSFQENALIKAKYYSAATGLPALADDSGLVVDALGGAPGIFSARYAPTSGGRIERVLKELWHVVTESPEELAGEQARRARFECAAAMADPSGTTGWREGRLEGWITFKPRGQQGFGYDPIFVPCEEVQPAAENRAEPPALEWLDGPALTLAQRDPAEKNRRSHRARALQALAGLLFDIR